MTHPLPVLPDHVGLFLLISMVTSVCHPALQSLVREPLSRRRQLLRENFVETEGEFVFATSLDTKDTEQIAEFLEQSVKGEGVPHGLCPPTLPPRPVICTHPGPTLRLDQSPAHGFCEAVRRGFSWLSCVP